MRGDVAASPFVSVCLDHAALAASSDPWARCIVLETERLSPRRSRAS
jgi:hypothetical protein